MPGEAADEGKQCIVLWIPAYITLTGGDRWMAKEGRETIHRLRVREFHDISRANLRRKKNQGGKMFCFDLYSLLSSQALSDALDLIYSL